MINWQKAIFDVSLFSLICIAFTLPFNILANNISIFLLIFATFFLPKKNISILKKNTTVFLIIFYYIILATSLFWTEDLNAGLFQLEVKFSLILLPIIITLNPKYSSKSYINIFLAFIIACLIISIYAIFQLSKIFYYYNEFTLWNITFQALLFHRPYVGLYLIFSILLTIYLYLGRHITAFITVTFLTVFIVTILLISAKNSQIILIVLIFLFLFWKLKSKNLKIYLLIIALAAISCIFLISKPNFKVPLSSNPQLVNLISIEGIISNFQYSLLTRNAHWRAALNIIINNWVIGVGLGDTQLALDVEYEKIGAKELIGFNIHNEYLANLVRAGILGFLSFIVILIFSTKFAIKQKNYLLFLFILIFSISCLTENILSTQKGAVFFSFFLSLLLNKKQ